MNVHMHPIMERALSPFVDWNKPAAAPAHWDTPMATVDAVAELRIGSLWIADIEGKITVYREGFGIAIDEIEITGQRHGKQALQRVGRKTSAMSHRDITDDEAMEHLCAGAFRALLDDPKFREHAEEALTQAENEWVQS